MKHFSEPQQEAMARKWLDAATRYCIGAWGKDAEDYVGIGLAKAVTTYDLESGTPWPAWMKQQLRWAVADGMRSDNGRPGSARHDAEHFSIQDYDQDATSKFEQQHLEGLEADESFLRALRQIEHEDGPARWALLCMVLGEMSLADAAAVAGVQPIRVRRALMDTKSAIREEQPKTVHRKRWLDDACHLRRMNPQLSDSQIAQEVGVHRCQLSRSEAYKAVRENYRSATVTPN